jgi:NADH-quinone oxidoreductase subunit F
LISACGNINKPGVYEIDMTISVEEFIYSNEYCGGIPNGKRLKACIRAVHLFPFFRQICY